MKPRKSKPAQTLGFSPTFDTRVTRGCPLPVVQAVVQPPPPVSEIRQKLERLYSETEGLERIVEHLIEKIGPVVRPFPRPDGKNECDPSKPVQVEISNDIERVTERLARLANRVSETVDAVAL